MFKYNYNIDKNIDLDDYKFNDYDIKIEDKDKDKSKEKPKPSNYRISTMTVNAHLFPHIKFDKPMKIIRKKYNIPDLTDELLKKIIIHRLIKDTISYEKYFDILINKLKTKKLTENLAMNLKIDSYSKFIDFKKIYYNTELNSNKIQTVSTRGLPIRSTEPITKKQSEKKCFGNQVTIRMLTYDKKRILNVMLFNNGTMTISGIRNNDDLIYIIEHVIQHVIKLGAVSKNYSKLYIENIKYSSINCHYSLNFEINNNKLYKIINSNNIENINYVNFEPSNFAGLKINCKPVEDDNDKKECIDYFLPQNINLNDINILHNIKKKSKKPSTAIVFSSGKINLYGVTSKKEIDTVYNTINQLISKFYNEII